MGTIDRSSAPHPAPVNDTQRVLDAIRKIVQLLRESARTTDSGMEITPAQLFALQRMPMDDGTVSMNELAARTFTHQSSISVVVKRLVERKLVRSAPSPTDGRRVALSLTGDGAKVLREAPSSVQDRLIRGLDKLPGEGRANLAALLQQLLRAMDVDVETPAAMFHEEAPQSDKAR